MRPFHLTALAALLCVSTAHADVLPTSGTWTTLPEQLYRPVYGACAAYDPGTRRIYVVGGYSNQYGYQTQSLVQYFDVDTHATGALSGSLWSSTISYNTNTCVVDT